LDQATYPEASGGQPVFESQISNLRFQSASLFGLAPRGVCLAARVATRAGALLLISNLKSNLKLAPGGRTVSPITWFEPEISIRNLKPNRGWSVLCCTCRRPTVQSRFPHSEFGIWNFRVDAPPLAGSLPFGVRTFLSFAFSISDLKFEI